MKRQLTICITILLLLCLISCGAASSSTSKQDTNHSGSSNEISSEAQDSISKSEGSSNTSDEKSDKTTANSSANTNKFTEEMLVYSCHMEMDVIEFDSSVAAFKNTLKTYEGFIESENYSDNSSRSYYASNNKLQLHTYKATARVPSSSYDSFVEGLSSIGNLRSKTANVQNVSQEYSDAKATLEIYEAKRDRYIKLLSTITDDSYAVSIEKELTNIEIEINKLKTSINKMDNDVAYSYVHIELNEVSDYSASSYAEKTFSQKLEDVAQKSWHYFLTICQGILFVFILLLPYILIIIIAVIIIFKIVKHRKNNTKNNRKPPQGPPPINPIR